MAYYSLIGVDGNAFSVMAYVAKAMKKHGYKATQICEYNVSCMNGNYAELIQKSMKVLDEINSKLDAEDDED